MINDAAKAVDKTDNADKLIVLIQKDTYKNVKSNVR